MALLPYFDLLGTCARIEFGKGIYTMPKNDMQCIQIEQIQGKLENEYPTIETLSDHFNSIVDPEFIPPLSWGFIPTRQEKENKMSFTEIDTNYIGGIPTDTDLVVVERSDVDNETFESAVVLYGFDEISSLGEWGFDNPVLGFLSN